MSQNLKNQLIKLGSENPELQEDIRPVLDSIKTASRIEEGSRYASRKLSKQAAPTGKARQNAIGYLQKTKKKAEESARKMSSARSNLIMHLDDLQRVLEQVDEKAWADFAGQVKKQLRNQTKRGDDPVSKAFSMVKDFPF